MGGVMEAFWSRACQSYTWTGGLNDKQAGFSERSTEITKAQEIGYLKSINLPLLEINIARAEKVLQQIEIVKMMATAKKLREENDEFERTVLKEARLKELEHMKAQMDTLVEEFGLVCQVRDKVAELRKTNDLIERIINIRERQLKMRTRI
ncbi:hypothetical protein OCU04_004104 [Sclerotinia nivalis]|uniref:Uncharacterized protein n=1 Tax=Sclerotinia nivalis TaxID=352851 RepID=A0A9X0APS5_9HELO|nr:hypothetical protein OCU04_004104 [Sclerotinia nivalis]